MFQTFKIQNKLNIKKNDIVLELGSGANPLFRSDVLLDKYPLISKKHRTSGKAALLDDRPFIVGDAQNLPFKDGVFDFVVARHLLEHLNDPIKFISEIKRVSKGAYIAAPSPFTELVHGGYDCLDTGKIDTLPYDKGTPGHKWFVFCNQNDIYLHAKCHEIKPIYLMFKNFLEHHTNYSRDLFFKKYPKWRETEILTDNCKSIKVIVMKKVIDEKNNGINIKELFEDMKSLSKSNNIRDKIKQFIIQNIFTSSKKFKIHELIACPLCKHSLLYEPKKCTCPNCGSFPIINDIPILIEEALNAKCI